MAEESTLINETLHIRNMSSNCCIILLKERLEKAGINVQRIRLGEVEISYPRDQENHASIADLVSEIGMELIESREKVLVEKIKLAVIELVHYLNNVDSIVRKSDYLVEKLGYSYQYLSRLFSAHESQTLEKYIINQKIGRIKELIRNDEYTLSEIAYMMDYSSVQYLSNQFHKVTGLTVSEFKSEARPEPPYQ